MIPLRNFNRFFTKAIQQPGYAAGVLLKRLIADGYYRFGNGRSAMPEAITLFLTHRCNLRCKMCGQWGESGVTKKQGVLQEEEPALATFCSMVDGIASFKPSITLFGGEPLLYRDCVGLINHIKLRKLHCVMITNGALLAPVAKDLVAAGIDELNISLDGDAPLHDEIRGLPGLFEKIVAGLHAVVKAKESCGRKKPLINLQCTINPYNYQYLERMVAVAENVLADSLTFHNLIFLHPHMLEEQKKIDELLGSSSVNWGGFIASPSIDGGVVWAQMQRIASQKHRFSIDMYPNFNEPQLRKYYSKADFKPGCRCLSPWIVAYIFPDGNVKPCLNSSFSFGNAFQEPFVKIWNSLDAVRFRRLLQKSKQFPACVRCTELFRY